MAQPNRAEMSSAELTESVKATFKDAAHKLTGHKKRAFMAKVTSDYLGSSARQAETVFGWNRRSVQVGLHERRTGLICVNNYRARGRHKSEDILRNLMTDIRALVETESQADPKFQTTFAYTRISARAVREALIAEKGYDASVLPNRQTIGSILNRMGYRLKKSKKPNP